MASRMRPKKDEEAALLLPGVCSLVTVIEGIQIQISLSVSVCLCVYETIDQPHRTVWGGSGDWEEEGSRAGGGVRGGEGGGVKGFIVGISIGRRAFSQHGVAAMPVWCEPVVGLGMVVSQLLCGRTAKHRQTRMLLDRNRPIDSMSLDPIESNRIESNRIAVTKTQNAAALHCTAARARISDSVGISDLIAVSHGP